MIEYEGRIQDTNPRFIMKIIIRLFNDNKRTNMQMEMRKMQ